MSEGMLDQACLWYFAFKITFETKELTLVF